MTCVNLRMRPLIETGMVVPVLEQAADLIADDAARQQTEDDLRRPDLTAWVEDQLVMEGPTARECLLFSAVDDPPENRDVPDPRCEQARRDRAEEVEERLQGRRPKQWRKWPDMPLGRVLDLRRQHARV